MDLVLSKLLNNLTTSYDRFASTHLDVEREVVQLQVLHEDAPDSPSLHDVRFSLVVDGGSQPCGLLRFAEYIIYIQQGIPELF